MGKIKTWTEQTFERYVKEGRGQGSGSEYKPWVMVQDFSSRGLSSREYSYTAKRDCHLLSNLELSYFLILDWSDVVVDILEQYPLPREETLVIAETKGIKHPVDEKSKVPLVMTSDFLIRTYRDGKYTYIVRSLKFSDDLENRRTIEKLEIERSYWEEHEVDWGLVTERDIPVQMVENIKWLRTAYYLEELADMDAEFILTLSTTLKERLLNVDKSILHICKEIAAEYYVEQELIIRLLRYLFARKEIRMDFTKKIQLSNSYCGQIR